MAGRRSPAATMSRELQVPLLGDRDRLGHRQRGEQPRLLERPPQPGRGAQVRRPGVDVDAAEPDPAAVEREETRDAVEEGRLARSVVADEAEDLPVAQGRG